MIRKAIAIATFLLTALALAATLGGCGEKQEPVDSNAEVKTEGLNLLLDWSPNPNHAGIYTGLAKGRFAERALNVKPQAPSDPAAVIQQVASGRADVGLSYQTEVLAARDKGAKVKAIASVIGTPLNSMIWLEKSKIRSVKDLAGKTIGYSGAYSEAYIKTILEKNGVDPDSVKLKNLSFNSIPALKGGKVDAVTDVYWNVEGVQLTELGIDAEVTPIDELGVPKYYELVLIASEETLADRRKSDKIRRFLAGLAEGTADAVANPALAAKSVYEADKAQQLKAVRDSLKLTLPVLDQSTAGQPFGHFDATTWQTFANWMRDNALLQNPPEPGAAYDNSLQPPATEG